MCLGIPGRIMERWSEPDGQILARADFAGEERVIRLNYLPDLAVGDHTIVHAGFALTRLTREDAERTVAMMRDVGLLEDRSTQVAAADPAGHEPSAEGELIDPVLAADLAQAALSLARSFHAGATLWVASPRWEPHAHHIAVEFVHPVVVGTRALPAVALTGPDLVDQARVAVRAGDAVVIVATADDPVARDLVRRAPAWGTPTWWIGYGPRPEAGIADHVLWVDDDPTAPATGRFALLHHLLWELTHVCFEDPGPLTPDAAECTDAVCVTCSDEGRLVEVLQPPRQAFGTALVRSPDGEEEIDVTLVGEVAVGDLVLVHAGSALTRVEVAR
jgi:hydrogenase assembly chaperone HypC/HupF